MSSKHTGIGSKGYPPRNFTYQTSPDNGRQYQRGELYSMSGGPGAGPGMRAMHHQQPQQPSTPPTQQDMKQPPHMHQMPPPQQQQQQQPQQGQAQMVFNMNQRQPGNRPFYSTTQPTRQPRPNMLINQQGGGYMPNQQVSFGAMPAMGQPGQPFQQMMIPPYSLGNTGNPRFIVTNPPYGGNNYYVMQYPQVVRQPVAQMPNSQMMMHQPPQPPQPAVQPGVMTAPTEIASSEHRFKARPNAIKIQHPEDLHDVVEKMLKEENSTDSGDSSARETPQLTENRHVASEFARKVAITLGDEAVVRQGSRNSSYSESEPQSVPELPQNFPQESMTSPKMDPKVDVVVMPGSEPPLVENSLTFTAEPGVVPGVAPRWGPGMPVPACIDHMVPVVPQMMVIPHGHEELQGLRPGMHPTHPAHSAHPAHAPREFQGWPQEPPPVAPVTSMGPGIVPNMNLPVSGVPTATPVIPITALPKKAEDTTPVVSALAQGPTVDISRDYPALGGQRHAAHQSPARGKRRAGPDRAPSPAAAAPAPAPAPVPVAAPSVPVPPTVSPTNVEQAEVPPPQTVPVSQPTPAQPAVTPVNAPVDAKTNHKSKSNKRQQRQEQQQQRQATPPPRPVTPVIATVVPPTAPQPAAPAPIAVTVPPTAPAPVPAAVEPVAVRPPSPAPRDPTPPPPAPSQPTQPPQPKATQAVDLVPQEKTEQKAVIEPQMEDRLVAAMNEENDKLTNKLSNNVTTNISAVTNAKLVVDNNNVQENNNVGPETNNLTNVTVVVEPVIENAKPVLRHNYTDDQWSPVNREGKKQYGREFIMQLMNDPESKKRPENLPPLEVLKSGGNMRGQMGPRIVGLSGEVPMPNFKSSSLRGSNQGRDNRDSGHMKRSSLLGNKGGKGNKPMPIQMSLSLNEDVKLREADAPWKPNRTVDNKSMTEDEKKTEVLNKKVRGVLNRLTPQKFDKLVKQVQALEIDTLERFKGVIDLVFEKAVDEPGFSVAYANMCGELSKKSIQCDATPKGEANFRVLLLQRCQSEFEKNPEQELKRDDRQKEIQNETDPEKKKEMILQLEEDERKVRVKSVGNIRFIGELYKRSMLTPVIMFNCIEHLLKLNTEESLECLCKLLTTIGRNLEDDITTAREHVRQKREVGKHQQLASADLNKYFDDLSKIMKNKENKVTNRVRFMIQDLIDLKDKRWVPRRDDAAPMTMDQIAKEAEREQIETNLALAAGMDKGGRRDGGGGRQDSRNSMDNRDRRRNQDNTGGWTQVASNSARKQYVETNKLRVNPVDTDLLCLGSRDSYIWNKGSGGGGSKSDERKQPVSGFGMNQNKFALLEESRGEKPQSRSSSLKGSLPTDPRDSRDLPRDSRDPRVVPRPAALEDDRSRSQPPVKETSQSPVVEVDCGVAARHVLEDFLSTNDFEESRKTLIEQVSEPMKGELVYNVFLNTLEKSTPVRRSASRLIAHFLQTASLTKDHILFGLRKFLEDADDLIVDIPLLWDYLAELVADLVAGGIGLTPVLEALGPMRPDPTRPDPMVAVAGILRIIHAERPDAPALAACKTALRAYLGPPQPYQAFLVQHKLEFLESAPEERELDENRIARELERLLRGNADFDVITAWVDSNVGPACYELPFIRILTNAILDNCLKLTKNETWKLETETLKRHVSLFSRYVDNAGPRELQLLYAIQAKMAQLMHPKGILCDLCQLLLDQGVVSSDSFKNWRSARDTPNMEGRGVCMTSLTSFFTMIDEDEDETS